MKTLIMIPSRLSATRLLGKPLLQVNGLSIISHVVKKAEDSNIGEVFVATEDQEIVDDVKKNGGQAILTRKNHKTGTDRIFEAVKKLNRADIDPMETNDWLESLSAVISKDGPRSNSLRRP